MKKTKRSIEISKSHEKSTANKSFKHIKKSEDFELAYNSYAIIKKGGLANKFLYLKGADVIEAEIKNIKERKL